ncbi:MAG: hypothetical protein P4L92_22795 [Rudaea sp.]|nr:hypothetical protein [Rudaea sp.]
MEIDWGLPNWKDATQYPSKDADVCIFAWEFIRRSDVYRSQWEAGEVALDPHSPHWERVANGVRVDGRLLSLSNTLFPPYSTADHWRDMNAPSEGQMIVPIDCMAPIDEQLRRIKILAELHRKGLKKRGIAVAHAPRGNALRPLPTYLRILDGIAARTNLKAIADELFTGTSESRLNTASKAKMAAIAMRDGGWRALPLIAPIKRGK